VSKGYPPLLACTIVLKISLIIGPNRNQSVINRYYECSLSEQMYRKQEDYWFAQCLSAQMDSAEIVKVVTL